MADHLKGKMMNAFTTILNGTLYGVLHWAQWDALRQTLRSSQQDGWYVYYVGHSLPAEKTSGENFSRILEEIDLLLRRDHQEDYLGIVYVDDFAAPRLVKIYDPHNLGSSCGSSGLFVPPGWVISSMLPEPIHNPSLIPQGRQRWWKALSQWLNGQPAIARRQ